jgi:hypothetical protein
MYITHEIFSNKFQSHTFNDNWVQMIFTIFYVREAKLKRYQIFTPKYCRFISKITIRNTKVKTFQSNDIILKRFWFIIINNKTSTINLKQLSLFKWLALKSVMFFCLPFKREAQKRSSQLSPELLSTSTTNQTFKCSDQMFFKDQEF